ncbi:AraC family transcriptional regulator [Spongiivirga sp. MCCC 1A20706]|uniref:helix-turn-helix domain-containing protein n=1 Tax=Spongiivirga sp. MCCC 1A20706 TaxID=3160963 RepID=UPI0039774A2C
MIQNNTSNTQKESNYSVSGDSITLVQPIDSIAVENGYLIIDDSIGQVTINLKSEKQAYTKELIIFSLLTILIALIIWSKFLKKKKKQSTVKIKSKEAENLEQKLLSLMKQDKVYLNQDLNLKELSEMIGENDKKISLFLNNNLGSTFYDFINDYRLNHFIEMLENYQNENYSIVGLAQESGFKSKSVFYRVFKKKFNTSPSNYIHHLRENVPLHPKG